MRLAHVRERFLTPCDAGWEVWVDGEGLGWVERRADGYVACTLVGRYFRERKSLKGAAEELVRWHDGWMERYR